MKFIIILCLLTLSSYSQSNIDKVIKSGEIIITGLAFLKDKPGVSATGIIDKICVRNKLTDTVTLNFSGTGPDGIPLSKSLVIQKDGKECLLDVPSGIYTYEIVLSNKEIFKRGEYRFDASTTITVKPK